MSGLSPGLTASSLCIVLFSEQTVPTFSFLYFIRIMSRSKKPWTPTWWTEPSRVVPCPRIIWTTFLFVSFLLFDSFLLTLPFRLSIFSPSLSIIYLDTSYVIKRRSYYYLLPYYGERVYYSKLESFRTQFSFLLTRNDSLW